MRVLASKSSIVHRWVNSKVLGSAFIRQQMASSYLGAPVWHQAARPGAGRLLDTSLLRLPSALLPDPDPSIWKMLYFLRCGRESQSLRRFRKTLDLVTQDLIYRVIFFTGTPPKSSKNKIKLEYQDWYPPKSLSTRTGTPSKMSVYKETWNNCIVIQY